MGSDKRDSWIERVFGNPSKTDPDACETPLAETPRRGRINGPPTLVTLDDRERASGLDSAIETRMGAAPKIRRLEVGDILIGDRVLIERKATADFVASLVDGRLFDQAAELRAQPFDALIVIEGDFDESSVRSTSGAGLRGAILTLTLDFRIPTLRSRSVEETASWIDAIAQRISRAEGRPNFAAIAPNGQRKPRKALPRRNKPRKIDDKKQAAEMLCQIQGVGPGKAQAILKRFGSVGGILQATELELSSVSGIGPPLAHQIMKVLHAQVAPNESQKK